MTETAEKTITAGGRGWRVTAHVIGESRSFPLFKQSSGDTGESRAQDPTEPVHIGFDIVPPPFDLLFTNQLREVSPALSKAITAMKTNVFGFGWELERAPHVEKDDDLPDAAQEEKELLSRLLTYPNHEQSFIEVGSEMHDDYEAVGRGYIEVVRTIAGDIIELHPLPAYSMRITPIDTETTTFTQRIRAGDGTFYEQPRRARFRRHVQMINGQKKVYFKEFGDPRPISWKDGEPTSSRKELASEVLVFTQGPNYANYGQPRWYPALRSVLGAHKAAVVNYSFFENKGIPPYILSVSGGHVPQDTVDEMQRFFRDTIQGLDNYHKGLIIEAVPMNVGEVEGEKLSTPTIRFEPLTKFINNDAQFLRYLERTDNDIVQLYRLPPIYFGSEKQYNFATALAAVRLAEQQVFDPERRRFEHRFNATILSDLSINFWSLKLKRPTLTDHVETLRAMGVVKEALPIGVIQEAVDQMRGVPREIDEELFNVTLADQRRQALALTPLNNGADDDDEEASSVAKTVDQVVELRKRISEELQKRESNEADSA